ncbi:MAG: DegT/DnrJ/EryC1/StrS family aminotransferase [Methylobacter sp.]|nr:DegT/DnrJ/EryC1/StrS family aminotransferase [Methylobacter sp.]
MIPMVNLKAQYLEIKDEIERGLAETIENCSFILGPNVQAFEKEAATYLGVKHLRALGVGPGDEVVVPANTYIATWLAVSSLGAIPVPVEPIPGVWNLDPERIEMAITPRTKVILPVHLFGQPADMTGIKQLCDQHNLKLIEDCCQSFGATINGKQTGAIGDSAGFSFFPSKNLGAFGDGGLVVTNSDETAKKLKMLHNHGSDVRYYHDVIGYNSRLDEMQAVILRAKLKRIDQYNQGRRQAGHLYSKLMADLPLTTPFEDGLGEHVYHQYVVLCDRRDEIMKALQDKQISCAIYYPVPLHKQNVFKEEYADVSLPVTEFVSANCFALPICPSLEDDTIREIVAVIRGVLTIV